ncbi:hypothetical protein [Thalassobellus suaedae]|uniref:Uncharacterized protein n=1 Tax=Thalassobellus suaedae TaxID=3074124 RepID=A0ABY9XTD9_9FLAO|nr:hypothetical protein RHP51_18725 [Flavobacteriaceae bacterium HL-DH14]
MEKTERIIFLIKFGQKKNLEKLRDNGEVYFKNTEEFNKIKKVNEEQGDENEGAIWIENLKDVKVTLNHPKIGEFNFKSVPNKFVKLTQFNHNYLTCSFYVVTDRDFNKSSEIEIDERMSELGEYALIITNPKNLIDSIFKQATSEKIALESKKVDYQDFSKEGKIHITPFLKKIEHSYQNEFRFVLKNCIEKSKVLTCKEIEPSGIIIPTVKNKKLQFKIN